MLIVFFPSIQHAVLTIKTRGFHGHEIFLKSCCKFALLLARTSGVPETVGSAVTGGGVHLLSLPSLTGSYVRGIKTKMGKTPFLAKAELLFQWEKLKK